MEKQKNQTKVRKRCGVFVEVPSVVRQQFRINCLKRNRTMSAVINEFIKQHNELEK